ncbi:Putative glucan endo-1,3-beta-glucosidase eglC [Verticillium dahliae VDG2]|nr:Putative glucan endo-1,3-beta-glucosidase eglC [Verticillium dahliae VDG2]
MNPHQKNKVDVSSLTPEEQRLFRLYGKLPSRSDHFAKHLKDRKYFDSGDYAMSKAGKGDGVDAGAVGSQHPVPENIPHLSSPVNGSGAPSGESSFLNRETSADGADDGAAAGLPEPQGTPSPASKTEGIPIRR